jgi:preprotein translocase subunit SecG
MKSIKIYNKFARINFSTYPFLLFFLLSQPRSFANFLTMPGDNASQPLLTSSRKSTKSRSKITLISVAVVFLGTSLYLASLTPTPSASQAAIFQTATDNHDIGSVQSPGISEKTLERGIEQCDAIEARKNAAKSSKRREKNPRAVPGTSPLLIRNGYIWTGNSYLDGYDILVDHGLIQKVEQNIETLPEYDIIDAKSRVITPGIVDMHSHIGVESLPMLAATTDGNEGTNPNTPYVCTNLS